MEFSPQLPLLKGDRGFKRGKGKMPTGYSKCPYCKELVGCSQLKYHLKICPKRKLVYSWRTQIHNLYTKICIYLKKNLKKNIKEKTS